MYFRFSAHNIVFKLIVNLLLSAGVGWLFDQTLLAVCFAFVGIISWHYHHLFKLLNWLWLSKSISPPQAEGVWGRVYDGLYRQIQKHRKKQKQLSEKVRKFRDAAEALPDAALVLSDDFTIQWSNKKAQRLLGVRWPGDFGQRIDNLLRAPEFFEYLQQDEFDSPCVLVSPVDHEMQLELRFMAYGSDQTLLLARDISRIHRLEEMRRDFVANVSHELKTPLTVVRGYVEMVQSAGSVFDKRWHQAFATIEGQVTRMDRLVEQLLNLSKVEIQTENDNKRIVNMPQLIHTIVKDVDWLNTEKQHSITADIDQTLAMVGLETELKSACANLVSNAIAYTTANGTIHVQWKQEGADAVFSVTDNGVGIKADDIPRLTERFFRIDKSRSRDTGGSGLGLAIVKHVLNHHSGALTIESELGKGSTFSLKFSAQNVHKLS